MVAGPGASYDLLWRIRLCSWQTAENDGNCVSLVMLRWIFRLIVLNYTVKIVNRLLASRSARRTRV